MRGQGQILKKFELDETIFRKGFFLQKQNDLKLSILEKVPFIKPFEHFLIPRKQNFMANFKFLTTF